MTRGQLHKLCRIGLYSLVIVSLKYINIWPYKRVEFVS